MKSPITLLAGIVLILGGMALGGSGVIHLLQPPLFEAVTTVRIANPPGGSGGFDPRLIRTEVETIQSELVLTNVIHELKLNDVWGNKYNHGQRLSDAEAEKMLRLDCRPIRNSEMVEIKVRSEDPAEAPLLANEIVKSYRQVAAKSVSVNIIMFATLPTRAFSPNRPLCIVLIAVGVIMALGGIFCLKDSTSDSES